MRREKPKPTYCWVLPRPRRQDKYRGGFPQHFEKNLIRMSGYPERILHPFGGMAEYGERVDLNPSVYPDYVGDAHNMHWFSPESFDLVILDPPYDEKMSKELYGTPKPRPAEYVKEAMRVLRVNGLLAIYHWHMSPRPKGTSLEFRIVVLTRVCHRPRICMVYRKRETDDNRDSIRASFRPPVPPRQTLLRVHYS